jgi:DnaJ-class molecular chaperone
MESGKRKLVSLSESLAKNSSKEVQCPACGGTDKTCKVCHGAGVITAKKKARLGNG